MRLLRGCLGIVCGLAIALSFNAFSPVYSQSTASVDEAILRMEAGLESQFEKHFGRELQSTPKDTKAIAQTLSDISEKTQTNPAVLWAMPRKDHLHLVLIVPGGEPIVKDFYDVPKSLLKSTANRFTQSVTTPRRPLDLKTAQQLYSWLIEPMAEDFLEPAEIDTLLFCVGDGLRGLPVAALHDGDRFLVEKYALAHIPAFSLIEQDYKSIQQGGILAMGASEFEEQHPLPAVPVELDTVVNQWRSIKPGKNEFDELSLLNKTFTKKNFRSILKHRDFDIVHIATHADFVPGAPTESYIEFDDGRLNLEQMATLDWEKADVDLLVLSACRTAIGDSEAELGFAGLALQLGVDSAIASLWYVSDAGTLALMGNFYQELSLTNTKAEALRQAQIRMIQGDSQFADDQLLLSRGSVVPLPDELSNQLMQKNLSHPYYWAGFSMISSPW